MARERHAERLAEKHSRAVFITAESRRASANTQYKYTELVYCERPDIQKFIDMVDLRRVVFEFTMTERPPGRVRNHGYPWRLVAPRELDRLFATHVKLRRGRARKRLMKGTEVEVLEDLGCSRYI